MITLVKPILFAFIKTTAVKELIVKLLEAYAKSTDNTVDDKLVELVKKKLNYRIMDELKKLPRKATEESFNELHYLVTEDFLA